VIPDTPARRLRDAVEPLAAQSFGAARDDMKTLGLRGIQGYMWGRAAALGEPSASVVVAAFGVFEPTFVVQAYESGRATASRDAVLAARARGATRQLESVLGDDPDIDRASSVLLDALDSISATARPLFSGLRDITRLDSPHGRLWQATDMVREHRGDGHLAACIAAGLDPVEMNVLTELFVGYPLREFSSTRGWPSDAIDAGVARLRTRGWLDGDALSADGATWRAGIEAATDVSQAELLAALGDELDWVSETTAAYSDRLVAAGAFTSDERKRAAG
jgi:hypothetical protein